MLRNRLTVLILFILSVAAISFYGGPVTYGFFFFMLSVPLISAAYTVLVYYRYRIYQEVGAKNIVVDTPTDFYFTLQNEDFYSFSGIKVEFFSDFSNIGELESNPEYELSPGAGVKKHTTVLCKYRGEYEIGIKNVIIQDYLRLFSINFKNRETLRAIVKPRLVILDSLSTDSTFVLRDAPFNPSNPDIPVREYVIGDDIKNINWKVSAHTGKPQVRIKTGEETSGVAIITDSCRYSSNAFEYLPGENKVLEITIALAHYCLDKGMSVSVHTYENMPKKYLLQGIVSFENFYEAMSDFTFGASNTSAKLFSTIERASFSSCSTAFMVVQKLSEETLLFAKELNKNGIAVVIYHVCDEAESKENTDFDKNAIYKRVGYEDRIKEVL